MKYEKVVYECDRCGSLSPQQLFHRVSANFMDADKKPLDDLCDKCAEEIGSVLWRVPVEARQARLEESDMFLATLARAGHTVAECLVRARDTIRVVGVSKVEHTFASLLHTQSSCLLRHMLHSLLINFPQHLQRHEYAAIQLIIQYIDKDVPQEDWNCDLQLLAVVSAYTPDGEID